jgi:tetratricopeptide (TPR) repeat protein
VQGNLTTGRDHLERALQENLAFFPAHEQLGRLALAIRDSANAVTEYAQAAELAPGEPWIQYASGIALMQLGRYADAVIRLEQAVQLEPLYSDAHLALAQAQVATGDSTAALHSVDEYLRLAPRRVTDDLATARRLREALATH